MPQKEETARRESDSPSSRDKRFVPPAISLPKGGGAIRGMGEKFAANPLTGTGALTVPLAGSPGRSGFGPQLSLSYESGSGNGAFGFGWSLSVPAITRKTDKGLPRYRDAEESDVFVLSGAEDLVPVLLPNGRRFEDDVTVPGYTIHRYRPRIEGLLARIERWTSRVTGEMHWRSITRDNVTTLYGRTGESRIADPADAARVFSWLICESYDDRGNALVYTYQPEDAAGVDGSQAHERNRTDLSRSANRYVKRIRYGNRVPNRDAGWNATDPTLLADWAFEVVFDYGEGHYTELPLDPARPEPAQHRYVLALAHAAAPPAWPVRRDAFSSHRAGFEVRTYRLCRRVLVFHHFPDELGVADYLVRSTDLTYGDNPFASFVSSITQSGYVRDPTEALPNRYLRKSLPPLELEYSRADIDETVREVDAASLENLPYGLDGSSYQWVDLDGEGVSGVLTEQGDGWFYKRNFSPAERIRENGSERAVVRLAPTELVAQRPAAAGLGSHTQLLDLAGDGQVDLVQFDAPVRGFYERTADAAWVTFRAFTQFPALDPRDQNLRFIDLDGDGHTDILVSEDDAFSWHASLAEQGFGPATTVRKPQDDENGPRLVFADGTQSIYLADMSGDGLTDLVRIRNGEVCYWPNLGHGRFGRKVTTDDAPWFDAVGEFEQRRVRLGDVDGSGTTDIFYLGRDGITIWRNQSGNRWDAPRRLDVLPPDDEISSVTVVDLLGNGTACLVWSSPLPGYAALQMRYVDLMSGQKPHLLIRLVNNLGAETRVRYAASTRFYVTDVLAGRSWITRLPFPVHVVERVETYDHVSRNRFVTRYAYHHGYFDGEEREFRGFGMIEQLDTEELAGLTAAGELPVGENIDAASHVPPVLTKTWFHTGVFIGRDRISSFFAGSVDGSDPGEYYREPGLDPRAARDLLLDDTVLPDGLSAEEEREACRALKGSVLRQEVYALDDTARAEHPYRVSERNYSVRRLQPRGQNRHAVFLSHSRETLDYAYERNPPDHRAPPPATNPPAPRISHAMTLEVDDFGNVLKSAAIGYGRRHADMSLSPEDQTRQSRAFVTYTENTFTDPVATSNAYRAPLPCETRSYELTGYHPSAAAGRFDVSDFVHSVPNGMAHTFDAEIEYEDSATNGSQRRLIEQVRTYYRPDDLGAAQNDPLARLPFGEAGPLGLPGELYRLAFTPGLLAQVYQRTRTGQAAENLLPDAGAVLLADVAAGQIADRGGYVDLDADGRWWIPSGHVLYSPSVGDAPADELTYARRHFFLPHRFLDPFGQPSIVTYDPHDLLVLESRDALDNRVTVGERNLNPDLPLVTPGHDYRVLQPALVMDSNRNCSAVAFDALGRVVGTAVMGKPEQNPRPGDSLAGFAADLTQQQIEDFFGAADPRALARALLGSATMRLVHDVDRFRRTREAAPVAPLTWEPVFTAILARETHVSDLHAGEQTRIQISFSYSDGFGREVQKKVQAEAGRAPRRDPATGRIVVVAGRPQLTPDAIDPRWVGTGWTIHNNKGKPVRQYEPFFTDTHRFEFDVRIGVSPTIFYDPLERAIATLHANHTYGKVVFDAWRQDTWDRNDTVLLDPRTDPDIEAFAANYFADLAATPGSWQTWHAERAGGALGPRELSAANKTALHANTPTTAHLDALGRSFLTLAHNGFQQNGDPVHHPTRVHLDVEGNARTVVDALDRVVMRYDYDLLGTRIRQASMEAGERWTLNDVGGQPVRAWDSRGHDFRTRYDRLRRPLQRYVRGTDAGASDPRTVNSDVLFERIEYGEGLPNDIALNLRARMARQDDGAGTVVNEEYDFKGNVRHITRQLAQDYRDVPNWSGAVPMDADVRRTSTSYDALNRPETVTTPDNTVIHPTYNDANLLEGITANLRGAAAATPFVASIEYDAKGRRTVIEYAAGIDEGAGVRTTYEYDPLTFRLARLLTRRDAGIFWDDCPETPPPTWPGCQIQNLSYTYDPAGNILHIQDDAQQTIYFRNRRVEPGNDYTYDAVYRLIEGTGREHLGQIGDGTFLPASPTTYNDVPRVNRLHRADGYAMGTYLEQFVYDGVGNIVEMVHHRTDPTQPSWRRAYVYQEPSLTEPGRFGNRVSQTMLHPGAVLPVLEPYAHDAHGNIVAMSHLQDMRWDFKDRLVMTQRQAVNAQDADGAQRDGERTYYVYDSGGQRVRKVTVLATNQLRDERLYLGPFEIYRRYGAGAVVRETLHISDDTKRIALIESRTEGDDGSPARLIRYQLGNHLGSAALELDDHAQVLSYEEYYPYGGTSLQTARGGGDVPKRYRFSGKERDEETGLSYHEARYYAPWLARWSSCDRIDLADGLNAYEFAHGSPVRYVDRDGLAGDDLEFTLDVSKRTLEKIAEGLRPYFIKEAPPGEGYSSPVHIDEPLSVGQKDIKPQRAVKRAIDPHNRQFLNDPTNTKSKGTNLDLSDIARNGEHKPPISVLDAPNELLHRRFDEVHELKEIFEEAKAKVRDINKLSPTEIKAAINENIRDIIKTGKGPAATRVREALAKLGITHVPGKGLVASAVARVRADLPYSKYLGTVLGTGKTILKNEKLLKAGAHLVSAGKHLSKPVLGLLFVVGIVGTAGSAYASVDAAAAGDVKTATLQGASAAADIVELTPTPAGAVVGVGRAGWAVGEAANVFLSDETKDAIGGTISETVEHGWENVRDFYFGWALK